MMFAARTEASKLNMLKGSPHRWLTQPILDYITAKGGKLHLSHRVREIQFDDGESPKITGIKLKSPEGDLLVEADQYLAACDVPGIQRLIPKEWRRFPQFAAIDKLQALSLIHI